MAVLHPEPVIIPQLAYATIVDHSRAGKPEEICGVLRGRGMTALEAIRGRNIAGERIENYEVDPQTLLLQFAFEDAGEEMMGIYHSHPVSVAYPSATDAWNAHYPECIYFICSLEFDEAPVLRAFRMTPHFIEADWEALSQQIDFYETRRGLFAFYRDAELPVPPSLAALEAGWSEEIQPPYYLVYFQPSPEETPEGHLVTLVEHPVQVVETAE